MTKITQLIFLTLTLALTIFAITYLVAKIYPNKTTSQKGRQITELYYQKLGNLYYGVLLVIFIGFFSNFLILFSNFYDYPINEGWKVTNTIFAWLLIITIPLIERHYEKLAEQEWESNNKKKTDHD